MFSGPSHTEYGTVLLGILVMQDILLGVLMAILPVMASATGVQNIDTPAVYILICIKLISGMLNVHTVFFLIIVEADEQAK